MANLGKLISDKASADAQWQERQKAEKERLAALRDACVTQITSDEEKYIRYLTAQGDNPYYSAGNVALAMIQLPETSVIRSRERWKDLGRFVLETEIDRGASIFARSATGRGYRVTCVYDLTQTEGRKFCRPQLEDGSPEMEKALTALLNFSPVQVVTGQDLPTGACYDPRSMTLAIDPEISDSQAFAAIAAEIAHARAHDRGRDSGYSRDKYELTAQSVSFVLCRRFGVPREAPDLSGLDALYQNKEPQERLTRLSGIQSVSRQIGGAVERAVEPPQRAQPVRRDSAR